MGKVLKFQQASLALEEFLWYKQAQGLAPRTLADYRKEITRFFRQYPNLEYTRQHDLKRAALEFMARDVKPATYNSRLTIPKRLFRLVSKRRSHPGKPPGHPKT